MNSQKRIARALSISTDTKAFEMGQFYDAIVDPIFAKGGAWAL